MPATLSRSLRMPLRLFLSLAMLASTLVAVSFVAPSGSASAATYTLAPWTRYTRAAIEIAPEFAGRPYRWGGNGPSSFDCSGYTRYVFAKAGKAIPRTTNEQYRAARKHARSQARVGDLVFIHGRGGVYHVGIYAGQGTYWHAPRTGDVVKKSKIYGNWSVGAV